MKLGNLREQYKSIPWVALTATASAEVSKDIVSNLKLLLPVAQYKTPSFRRNLFYDVIYQNCIEDEVGHLMEFLKKSLKEDENVKPVSILLYLIIKIGIYFRIIFIIISLYLYHISER